MSILQLHETTNSFIPTQKQNTTITHLFFPRAIRRWNELPTEIKDAPNCTCICKWQMEMVTNVIYFAKLNL